MDSTNWIFFVAGILATPLGTWLTHFVQDVIIPYIAQQTYKSVSMTDTWRVLHVGDPTDGDGLACTWSVSVTMRQTGQKISGKATATCITGETNGKNVYYRLSGKFSDGVLDVSFCSRNPAELNRSSFLLQVVGAGNELEGMRLFNGRRKNCVRAVACQWIRDSQKQSSCGTA